MTPNSQTESAEKRTCSCISYNRPDLGGTDPEVVLDAPEWLYGKKKQVCIDACIAQDIQNLWENHICTYGSCCGHGRDNPNVILSEGCEEKEINLARKLLPKEFVILQWKLTSV